MTPKEAQQHKHTGEGWDRELVKPFLEALCAYDLDVTIFQIKEKFGTLNIYISGPEWIEKLASIFERASEKCCEDCGRWEGEWSDERKAYTHVTTNTLPRGYWIKTLCFACREERQKEYDQEVSKKGDVA